MSSHELPTAADTPRPDSPQRRIGPYRLLEELGEGGFGVVWLAEQSEPVRRRVALKLLKPGMDSSQVLARFEAERQALALMDHPCVARVLDAGVDQAGRPYFAMEYVPGVPITAFCDEEHLDLESRVRLMTQVCEAVQHAHMKGVIHRDLKPSNILVTLADRKPTPKVIDFGVAKALTHRLSDTTIYTERGQMIGTPEYMSPEQARGSGVDVDTRADVYSLGAVLYELLTGSPPFDPKSLREGGLAGIQRYIEHTEPPKPSTRISTVASAAPASPPTAPAPRAAGRRIKGDLDWIVMRCLEKERSRRYDTAAALADDLERFLRDEPVEAGPPTAAYRLSKFIRRNRAGVAAGAAVAAALVLATALSLTFGIAASRDRALAAAAEQEALHRAAESDAVVTFLTDMLASVQPGTGDREVTVRQALNDAGSRMPAAFDDQPLVEARLRDTLAQSYSALGLFEPAETHLRRSQDLYRRTLPPTDERLFDARSSLAQVIGARGRVDEAELAFRDLEREQIAALGEAHPLLATTRARLASLYVMLENAQAARAELQKAVPVLEAAYGPTDKRTLAALGNLADVHAALFEFDAAQATYTKAIDAATDALGPEHPQTLGLRSNLALLHRMNNRADLAREINEDILPRLRRVLGDDLVETLNTINNLAITYKRLGLNDLARPLYEEDLEASIRTLGETHPSTLVSMTNWAAFLADSGSAEEAVPFARRTIDLMTQAMGPDFIGIGFANRALADACIALRDDEQALAALTQAHRIISAQIAPDAPPALETAALAAAVCQRLGRADDAAAWRARAGRAVPPTLDP